MPKIQKKTIPYYAGDFYHLQNQVMRRHQMIKQDQGLGPSAAAKAAKELAIRNNFGVITDADNNPLPVDTVEVDPLRLHTAMSIQARALLLHISFLLSHTCHIKHPIRFTLDGLTAIVPPLPTFGLEPCAYRNNR